jgi:glutathione S-transferase
MITLFLKTGCPFCRKVLAVVDAYGIPFEEKNVADPGVYEEMVRLGGRKQEPFMVDGDIMMYESSAIIEYLEHKYSIEGTDGVIKPCVHSSSGTEVCAS